MGRFSFNVLVACTVQMLSPLLLMARLIKRYENRKLYDTEASQYVSLSDIAHLVRTGETVRIVDNATGRDLTAQTLTQIILEEGKRGEYALPTDTLHALLRQSGRALDSGWEQIRSSVDDLLQGSMSRLETFVKGPQAQELEQLRTRLRHLERQLTTLMNNNSHDSDVPSSTDAE